MTSKELSSYLTEKGADFHAVYEFEDSTELAIHITWGDWKHSHLFADHLMRDKGYAKIDEQVTEEDGSDCYSSIHLYKLVE